MPRNDDMAINLDQAPRKDLWLTKIYKDRLVIAEAILDKETGKWTARVTIAHTMYPAESFDTEEEAETFARNRIHRQQDKLA
jgi:hypothetical protein